MQAGRTSEEELESRLADSTGADRIELLTRLAALITERDPERGARLSREALELSRACGSCLGEASAHFGIGDSNRVRGDYRGALEHYSLALQLFDRQGQSLQAARCLRRLGDIHYFVTNLDLSLRYYLRALRVFEELAEREDSPEARLQAGHLQSTIGNVLKQSGDPNGALDYYRRSRAVYIREGFLEGVPGVLHNMGDVLQERGMLAEAGDLYRQALEDARARDDHYLASLALNSIGSVCLAKGSFDEAGNLFEESLEISERTGRRRGILNSLMKQLELRRSQERHTDALELASRSEQLALELNDRGALASILQEKALLLQLCGDSAGAFESSCRHQKIRDEFLAEKRLRQIDILRLRYETEAKEREIERLRRDRAVQRMMIAGAAAGLILAGVSLSAVYRSVRLRTRVNRELNAKNNELASAYSKVEELSRTDELTGLANRRAMMERLSNEQARYARNGRHFGLILGDIDDFKSWNDRCGHACGDYLLEQLSERLKTAIREQDLASRWGGEEFLVLLPDTEMEGSVRVAEKLRARVSAAPFTWQEHTIRLTMTFGVCQGGPVPVDEALRLADTALYKGKRLGKNRVETSRR